MSADPRCPTHCSPLCDTEYHKRALSHLNRERQYGFQALPPVAHAYRKSMPHTGGSKGCIMTFRNGLSSLLRPEDSVLVLIDHQAFQLTNVNSHDPQAVVNNVTALAKLAKAFNVPTILTSVLAARGGLLFKQITDVFPEQ